MDGGGRNNFGRRGGGASGGRAGGRGGHGGGRGRGRAPQGTQYQTPVQQHWVNRPPVQAYQGGAGGSQVNPPPAPRAWGNRPEQPDQGQGSGIGVQRPAQQPMQVVDIQSLKISERQPISSPSESTENRTMPIERPDRGGSLAIRTIPLHVNHFPVNFNPNATIIHYDVDVKPVASPGDRFVKKSVSKSDLRLIRDKLFSSGDSRFPLLKTVYDGEKNIFSAVTLPTGAFKVELSDGEDSNIRSYLFTIKFVNQLELSKLKDYLMGNLSYIPRDILQGMDLVMKDNPSKNRISVGRSFYSPYYRERDDLRHGLAAYRGFQQSLRPTCQGLSLCLDYSILAFRKPLPVLEFLKEHVQGFNGVNDVTKLRQQVIGALKGLKVKVTHRVTKQKYTVSGLTTRNARGISFTLDDPDGINPPTEINLVRYFMDKWGKDIVYKDIPCLDFSKNNRPNYVPMEFCVLVEGQRYPNDQLKSLDKDAAVFLRKLSLAPSHERKDTIYNMVNANDGPCGDVMKNFEIGVDKNMTRVAGRVIGAPDLKLGSPSVIKVDKDKCQWNLVGKSLVEGKSIERWALIDFTYGDEFQRHVDPFINNLRRRCRNLGMFMDGPLWYQSANMRQFSSISRIEGLLRHVVKEAMRIKSGKLQLIVCVMTKEEDPGYRYLKFVSETKIGVITQCCLSKITIPNKGQDQYFTNLCIKINAKLGGSNMELSGRLPHFEGEEHVMFIGADVNHPGSKDPSCPSIAAVVGTVNWPAANRYAARVCPQGNGKEKILNFGTMCSDLVNTYARINGVRPSKIVVFHDGVSEGQFDMVLNEELIDLRRAIYNGDYEPTITLVVAIKRHQTRLFLQNARDGNVPPGTVVDTTIVHPFEFDFYLCSHYGGIGTSKPTHYYVLWDENYFTSDSLQKLIHHMCFTFARCTKPVSLVPPVYYADLVAYRGRLFQQVAMEFQSRESSSSSSSSSAAAASFDQSFYTLHPELQNIMFFV
ncbi:argonaute 2-like [Olea europaea subsp. europaea]|uniref:Argonaute 2-like n=2 Tax=Olea europaea subsp. europaea TaxID=158383 RepID=A0A8S0RXK5_OLEEU|nr:argonaute 2-like [Olea europaea subsp. europaea]